MATTITQDDLNHRVEQAREDGIADARTYLARRLAEMDAAEVKDCDGPAAVSADFLAGLRFAAELVGDPNFDY